MKTNPLNPLSADVTQPSTVQKRTVATGWKSAHKRIRLPFGSYRPGAGKYTFVDQFLHKFCKDVLFSGKQALTIHDCTPCRYNKTVVLVNCPKPSRFHFSRIC